MTSYEDVLKDIFELSCQMRMLPSLKNIEKLCKIYNQPQHSFPAVHVAGTNGKGSVCTKIAKTLECSGYKTGLYTSPHITTFRERIQINGEMISEEDFTTLFLKVKKTLKTTQIPASFFEVLTLIAFLYFQEKKVEIAVLETGLGGRCDATNLCWPLLTIITSISYDHKEILGETLEAIAKEKGGILKEKIPVIVGPHVPLAVFTQMANEKNCPLYQSLETEDNYDVENQGIVKTALNQLASHFPIAEKAYRIGLEALPPCRFEKIHNVLLDVAHNPDGFTRLIARLKKTYPFHHYRFILGFSKGKEIAACAKMLSNSFPVHLVSGEHPRLASVEEISPHFTHHEQVFREENIQTGIENALKALKDTEILVIAGSFFIMEPAKKALYALNFLTSSSPLMTSTTSSSVPETT